jgi:hypothetical protein
MKKIIAAVAVLAPSLANAQAITDFNTLTNKATNIGNVIISILVAFAVLYIVFNAVRFVVKGDDPEARKTIGMAIIWGIVGLFVIGSIWGLVAILSNTFRTNNNVPSQNIPTLTYPPQVP